MTKLTDNLYAVEVPEDATNFTIGFYKPYWHIQYNLTPVENYTHTGGFAFFYKDFGGKNKYPDKLEFIGTVTKDSIDFDCEPFSKPYRKLYLWGNNNDVFRSLLTSKGLTDYNKLVIIKSK